MKKILMLLVGLCFLFDLTVFAGVDLDARIVQIKRKFKASAKKIDELKDYRQQLVGQYNLLKELKAEELKAEAEEKVKIEVEEESNVKH